MFDEKLTPEQLRKRFEEWGKSIKSGVYDKGGSMSHPVLRRRVGFVVLGGLYPQYEKLSEEEIIGFESILREKIIELYHYDIIAAQKIIEGYVSDDSFLYFRCWLISQGQNIFKQTLNNPDYLADIVEKNRIYDLEDLLYVTTIAFEKKTGRKEDENFPRDICDKKGLNYDLVFSPPKGDDWEEKNLPIRFPKLFNKMK